MEQNLEQLKCGQCAEEKHTLYIKEDRSVIVECTQCKSTSLMTVWTNPKIEISNHSGLGTICTF